MLSRRKKTLRYVNIQFKSLTKRWVVCKRLTETSRKFNKGWIFMDFCIHSSNYPLKCLRICKGCCGCPSLVQSRLKISNFSIQIGWTKYVFHTDTINMFCSGILDHELIIFLIWISFIWLDLNDTVGKEAMISNYKQFNNWHAMAL